MSRFAQLFGRSRSVIIGMIHLRALPGSPNSSLGMEEIINIARTEAHIFRKAKVDALLVENMHDIPWVLGSNLGPETTACMTAVCTALRSDHPHAPIGVQVLCAGNQQALAIAKATGLNFIRTEGFVFSHIGDEGPIHACAGELLRYRRHIGATDVQIFTDIKKKHSSHAVTSDLSLAEMSKAAELFLSDGIIVTGSATAEPTNTSDITDVQTAVELPVLVGSGVTIENVNDYMTANAIIIGSHFKLDGHWSNEVDHIRVDHFMRKVKRERHKLENGESARKDDDTFTTIQAQGE